MAYLAWSQHKISNSSKNLKKKIVKPLEWECYHIEIPALSAYDGIWILIYKQYRIGISYALINNFLPVFPYEIYMDK